MENNEIAQWVFGIFVAFAGILAIGKILVERDEKRGYSNVYFRQNKKRSDWFKNHVVKRRSPNHETDKG